MRYPLVPVLLPLLLLCLCLAPLAVPADAVVKIMPLGDSITRGDTWPASPHPSYRYYLDDSLRARGFAVDFVGSTSSAFSRFVFDQQHEGHGGYTTGMMAGSVSGSPLAAWLAASPTPEIVLLHVGTNDALTGVPLATRLANVRSIVTVLRQKNPAVRVLVAQIIPTANATFNTQSALVAYNKALPALAAGLSTPSSPVSVVDLYTGYSGIADNQADGIHPTTSGEKKMAAAWQRALVPVLSATPATTKPTAKPTTKPTTPAPSGRAVPGTIEAEDYDTGGEGVGYHDTTAGNHDSVYRRDGVDLSVNPSGGYNVGYVVDGEWLAYTLAVPSAGTYTVSCSVASWADGRSLALSLDGTSLGTLAVPNNRCVGWRTVSTQVALPAGSHRLVVRFGGDRQILDRIAIGAVATPTTAKPATAKPTVTSPAHGAPGTLEAEDYATGGEGAAYHDSTKGNSGGAYRNDDVDVEAVPGGHAVCFVRDGEWLRYSLPVASAGTYTASFRVAAWGTGAHAIEVSVNDRPAATVAVPSTGSFNAWTDATTTLSLPAGPCSLKLRFAGDGQNLDRVVFTRAAATTVPTTKPTTPVPLGRPVPGTIEAEDYDAGGEGVGYHDTTAGNHDSVYRHDGVDLSVNPSGGYNVGYVVDGEWLAYTLAVPSAGTYTVSCSVASWADGRSLALSLDGTSLGTLAVPNNRCVGWRTVSRQVTLPAGSHRLVVRFGGDRQILDRIAIGAVATPTTTAPTTRPMTLQPAGRSVPGVLEAEDFNPGGEGVAYHDTTAGNSGGAYRSDDVDVEAVTAGGHAVCFVRDGEWLRYTLSTATTGTYRASFRAAAWGAAAHAIEVSVNDRPAATVAVPSTGSFSAWTDATTTFALPAGTSSLRLKFVGDGQNLDRVVFTPVSVTTVPTTKPTTPTPTLPGRGVPATIEAEDYDAGGEGVGYHDTTPSNHDNVYRRDGVDLSVNPSGGYNVGYVADGEWLAYTLAVPSAGTYTVSCTVASWADGRSLALSLDGAALGTLSVPNNRCSGWRTVSRQVTLLAGSHRLVVRFGGDRQILDRITVATPTPTTKPTTQPTVTDGVRLPAQVQAEDYVPGGFSDTTPGNQGGAYRKDGVDIAYSPSAGSHVVTRIQPGEWLEYVVDAPQERDYLLDFRLSSPSGGQFVDLKVDGRPVAMAITPRTGSYDAYATVSTRVRLARGSHRLRVQFSGAGQDFDAFGLS